MSELTYYALWLVSGLVAVAGVSAGFTRLMRRREQALALVDALARHSLWVAAQRSRLELDLQRDEADAALAQARQLQARWFPGLARDLANVTVIDQRIEGFLLHQARLRVNDPEAWLESDQDGQFMGLWREYLAALERLTARLQRMTGEGIPAGAAHRA